MSTSSSKNPTGSGSSGGRDLHAERAEAARLGDTAKVDKLDREIAEQQNPSQPGSTQQ